MREGISVNTGKLREFSAKKHQSWRGFDWLDSVDQILFVGSRSDGCGGTRAKQAAGLDLARRILIRQPGTLASGGARGAHRPMAAAGGGARRRSQTRAPGHDLKRG
jgi:hypothetical protein